MDTRLHTAEVQMWLSVATVWRAIEDSPVFTNCIVSQFPQRAVSPRTAMNIMNKRDSRSRIQQFDSFVLLLCCSHSELLLGPDAVNC